MHEQAALAARLSAIDPYEARLVARAREGASDAWDEIYTRHYAPIYRYIHARVFDPATAEDLTSSVFLGAVKSIRSYRYHGQPFLAWLYRIARNVVGSHQRKAFRQRHVTFASFVNLRGRVFGHPTEPVRDGAENQDPGVTVDRMDLRDAIAKLPEAQRDALLLKFFVGLEAREIASIVGKDTAAVYSLQARALEGLRRYLVQTS